MPVIEIRQHINAPPEAVWNLLCDIERGPERVTVMEEVLYVSNDPLVGKDDVYRERSKIGPSTSETEWHITEFDPPHHQVHICRESSLKVDLTMEVEPAEGGALLIHRTDYQITPVFRPLGWVVEKLFAHNLMTREMNASVQNAKRIFLNNVSIRARTRVEDYEEHGHASRFHT